MNPAMGDLTQLRVEELSFEDAMTLVELDDEVPMQLGDFADGMSWLLTGDVCFFTIIQNYIDIF